MRRSCLILAAVMMLWASPALAQPVNLLADTAVGPGHVEVYSYGYYAPVQLKVIDGHVFGANPPGRGYHWFVQWNSVEVGVMPDTSLTMIVPLEALSRFDGSERQAGLSDLGLGLSRQLMLNDRVHWRSRLHLTLATGDASRFLGAGVPAVGLDNAIGVQLIRDRLRATFNANYLYNLRGTQDDPTTGLPVTSWRGQTAQLNASLEANLTPSLSLLLEVLGVYDSRSEQNRQAVATSSDLTLSVAPAISYVLNRQVTLQGSLVVPAILGLYLYPWGGYQDIYQLEGMAGAQIHF